MRLSIKSEYACLALIELARQWGKEPAKITYIAQRQSIPKKFLEQILLQLKTAGYVMSRRGIKGGYELAYGPEQISVAQIIRLIDGALAPVNSVSKYYYRKTPIASNKKLISVFQDIRDYTASRLENTTLADLL